jgi:hypothetical protein
VAAVKHPRPAVVRVDRSEDTHLVALADQLTGELIDVACDPSR